MKYLNNQLVSTLVSIVFVFISLSPIAAQPQGNKNGAGLYSKSNLVAWCIVPFDNKNRNPEERAVMLNKLGINKLAYDWRQKHVASFDEELDALSRHRIELQAFWYSSGMEPEKDPNYQLIIDVLKRHHVTTQIWCMVSGGKKMDSMSQQQKVVATAGAVRYLADKAAEIGCSVGLYNHGGWFGEPENQLAIINFLKLPNVGMVYNFSHAEYQIQRLPDFLPKILPHLYAINITGMQGESPATVVPIGQGNLEMKMMEVIKKSGYTGPIGIINENFSPDAETGLQLNIDGLKKILQAMGDVTALATYSQVNK